MKRLFTLLALAVIATACNHSDDNTPDPTPDNLPVNLPDIPCEDGNIQVSIGQSFRFVDSKGNWSNAIDWDYLSLSAVDPKGNLLYNEAGVPIKDYVNYSEIIKGYNDNEQVTNLFLKMGYVYEEVKEHNYAVSYFKLQLNKDRIDDITIYYDIRCQNQFLYKIVYNGQGYMADAWNVIDIKIE